MNAVLVSPLAPASVAPQQKFVADIENLDDLSPDDLHQEIVLAREGFANRVAETHQFAAYKLIPLCEEIIKRYKKPGVAFKKRPPNGQPTVQEYFDSINLNYSTVRSWICRERMRRAMFDAQLSQTSLPMLDVDNRPIARRIPDYKKIERAVKRIKSIADGHDIDLRSEVFALLRTASQRFGMADYPDPAEALATVGLR